MCVKLLESVKLPRTSWHVELNLLEFTKDFNKKWFKHLEIFIEKIRSPNKQIYCQNRVVDTERGQSKEALDPSPHFLSKDSIFYLLWYNVIRWSCHIQNKSFFLSFHSLLLCC